MHVCCWPFSLAWHALARRSTIAAKRIKDLIAESVDGVRKDAGSVTEVGATMKKSGERRSCASHLMEGFGVPPKSRERESSK